MDLLRFYTSIYTLLNNPKGMPYWVLSPIRRAIRILANHTLPIYLRIPVAYSNNVAKGVIVSLTSFPGRIAIVWQVIETLKRQSVRPEKILLWLSKEQFPKETDIPFELRSIQDEVFGIRIVEGDIRSHKKYFYVMQEFPDYTIITCDDDIYYHPDLLKYLIATANSYPHCITANVTNQLQYNDEELCSYNKWQRNFKAFSSHNRVQIGLGGVLYPPHSINKMAFRKDLLIKLAPLADDLWLNSMARLAQTPVIQTEFHYLWMDIHIEAPSLSSVNNGIENMNDKQLRQIREFLIAEGLQDIYAFNYVVG